MMTYRILCRGLTVLALLAVLLAGSVPAQARPLRPALPRTAEVTAFGERLWAFFASLWQIGAKEGVLIDPNGGTNGGTNGEGVLIDPNGAPVGADEGMPIDLDGQH